MRKTSLTIDDDLIADAGRILGTSGAEETIDCALRAVLAWEAREALIQRFATGNGLDLPDQMVMDAAWRE